MVEKRVWMLSWEILLSKKTKRTLDFISLLDKLSQWYGLLCFHHLYFVFLKKRPRHWVALTPQLFLWISSKVINVVYWAEESAVPWFVKTPRRSWLGLPSPVSERTREPVAHPNPSTTTPAALSVHEPLSGVGHVGTNVDYQRNLEWKI